MHANEQAISKQIVGDTAATQRNAGRDVFLVYPSDLPGRTIGRTAALLHITFHLFIEGKNEFIPMQWNKYSRGTVQTLTLDPLLAAGSVVGRCRCIAGTGKVRHGSAVVAEK